jgi:hypothetical protein
MSADVLREAATLMRARAQAVRDGADEPDMWFAPEEVVDELMWGDQPQHGDVEADAAHIASWHPGVALGVAELLENEASLIDSTEKHPDLYSPINGARVGLLVTIARAYLGRDE